MKYFWVPIRHYQWRYNNSLCVLPLFLGTGNIMGRVAESGWEGH